MCLEKWENKREEAPKISLAHFGGFAAVTDVRGRYGEERGGLQLGSGDLYTTDTCATNRDPLPNGAYNNYFFNKQWGNWTVRGYVWHLGDKRCPSGTNRTNLYIHSKSYTGAADGVTLGCIEIGQGARAKLAA